MKKPNHLLPLTFILILIFQTFAHAKNPDRPKKPMVPYLRTTSGCPPASSTAELNINNVRCLIHNGGDMWWDLQNNPRYEIPKVTNAVLSRHSSFAGSLWIGGIDDAGQLKVAAQTYRESGNDFWPGPLTSVGGTTPDNCEKWDKHYVITRAEITAFRAAWLRFQQGGPAPDMSEFPAVATWPAVSEDSEGMQIFLAPFVDVDHDFQYNPSGSGDYPDIRPMPGGGEPDQAIWWVINDMGNVHTETGGEAIGIEIQMLAFAFSTSNAVNNMTFYKYKVINKNTLRLNQTYMGQWADSDVGNPHDDYVGCDKDRGLGFCFNAEAEDEGPLGYGFNPPAFGMDFFQGPIGDNSDRLKMSKFVYYQNDFSLIGNPEIATHYYGYLRGSWKDGSPMVKNNTNGYGSGPPTDFMFDGNGGWCGTASGWSEPGSMNPKGDRRFLMSAGPFTLQSGAVNEIITGAVWARASSGGNLASVCDLLEADDLAQALFDSKFRLLDGPDSPELAIEEFDGELVLSWDYSSQELFNNFNESYIQADPALVAQNIADSLFNFEGYMVYQLKDATVSQTELNDMDKARLIAQCDLKNDISTIINRTETVIPGFHDPMVVDEMMVQGENKGIIHSLRVTEDQFAQNDDRRLKNYSTYHFGIIAYSTNEISSDGKRFVPGNRFFVNTDAIPHRVNFENYGTLLNSNYGDGIEVTQTAGYGNGGNFVRITQKCEEEILLGNSSNGIQYQSLSAPIKVKIVNAKELQPLDYQVEITKKEFTGETTIIASTPSLVVDSTFIEWKVLQGNDVIYKATYVQRTSASGVAFRPQPLSGTERVIPGHGFSISVLNPTTSYDQSNNPVIGAEIAYADPSKPWLSGLGDDDALKNADGIFIWNWILSGIEDGDQGVIQTPFQAEYLYDPKSYYEKILDGSWAPMCLAAQFRSESKIGPGAEIGLTDVSSVLYYKRVLGLDSVPDIDIVFTPDPNKWSKCIVVETSPSKLTGSGAPLLCAKWEHPITNPLGNINTNVNIDSLQGESYFPGYAINVNTGERLNIFFGENSFDKQNNGDDLLWNPTSDFGSDGLNAGGRHYIYVSSTPYDECAWIKNQLQVGTPMQSPGQLMFGDKLPKYVYEKIAWVGVPLVDPAFLFSHPKDLPSETKVSLRVNHPFSSSLGTTDHPIFNFSMKSLAAQTGIFSEAKKSLQEMIRVVPNPYYANSRYEQSQLQNIVKIINLPQRCKIRIFTLNGNLIRTYDKDDNSPDIDWDLKNQAGVPIASGAYIIHIDGFELGEAVVKFFGIIGEPSFSQF